MLLIITKVVKTKNKNNKAQFRGDICGIKTFYLNLDIIMFLKTVVLSI